MGGPARLAIDSANASKHEHMALGVDNLLKQLERRYSRYDPTSLVSLINARAGSGEATELDTEAETLFDFAGQLWEASDGLFDITSGVLRRAWDFRMGSIADPERIEALLPLVGWQHVERLGNTIRLPVAGMEIDLGGLVKEYAADAALQFLRDCNIESAMIELAGDVATLGRQASGQPWQIAIQAPDGGPPIRAVSLVDAAVATSGDYARRITHNGHTYGHFLDPMTGWPVSGPSSVTVIDQHCLTAGAVATIACLKAGLADHWLNASGLPWLMIDAQGKASGPILEG